MRDVTMEPGRKLVMTCDAAGGVWTYALDLVRGLRRHGIESVLAGFGPAPAEAQLAAARELAEVRWTGLPLDWMVRDRAELSGVAPALAALAAETGADAVQVNAPSQAAGLATDARVIAVSHSCVVTWFRAVRGCDVPHDWRWHLEANADGLARADHAVAPSRAHADLTVACYPGCRAPAVVPNAIGAGEAGTRRQPFVYAAARWWDEGKDAATLDAVAAKVDWPVLAFGPTEREGVAPVHFAHTRPRGDRPHAEVRRAAGLAGIFVSPSRYEPFGLAALEAAAGGAALVLSDIPTYREIWEDAALFAPPRDAAAFAARINDLARDLRLRARLAEAARQRAARFSLDAQAQAMAALFAGALHEREPA